MLELYHAEPTGASARVLIVLEEKALEFRGHYVEVLAPGQYRPSLEQLAPGGDLPVLVREGVVLTGVSAVCELLEEAYSQRPLLPAAPYERWCVRLWQKHVDDILAPAVGELAWRAYGERSAPQYEQERLARAQARVADAVARVESSLAAAEWIAGARYSLADVAVFAYFNYLPALGLARLSPGAAPRTLAWLRAVSERPAVRAALAHGRARDPFTTAIPPPEQIRWG